jgi:hypothetical protein
VRREHRGRAREPHGRDRLVPEPRAYRAAEQQPDAVAHQKRGVQQAEQLRREVQVALEIALDRDVGFPRRVERRARHVRDEHHRVLPRAGGRGGACWRRSSSPGELIVAFGPTKSRGCRLRVRETNRLAAATRPERTRARPSRRANRATAAATTEREVRDPARSRRCLAAPRAVEGERVRRNKRRFRRGETPL